jgi:hypothetical protein
LGNDVVGNGVSFVLAEALPPPPDDLGGAAQGEGEAVAKDIRCRRRRLMMLRCMRAGNRWRAKSRTTASKLAMTGLPLTRTLKVDES